MRIAVCDDCMEDARLLCQYLEGHEAGIYPDAGKLLKDIEENDRQFDLYLLDIFMEESMNGMELAKNLRRVQEDAVICFVSTSDDFYREAYDLYAVQYLIKPVEKESVTRLLRKTMESLAGRKGREKTIVWSWWGKSGAVPYGKIRYISSRGHTLSICRTDGKVQESTGKLNDLEQKVCGDALLRCHQSFIVNMCHVEDMQGMELVSGGERIPVSRRYYAEVKKRYQEMLFEGVDW